MLGERFARRLFRCGTRRLRSFDEGSAFAGLELFQPQLELLDLTVELLGTPAELHAAQFRDQQLQMLDLGLGAVAFAALCDSTTSSRCPMRASRSSSMALSASTSSG